MQVPLDISFQHSEPSEEIRSEIERQAKHLEKFHDRITSCNVTVIAPKSQHQKGDLFKIDIRIAMPSHKDIIVTNLMATRQNMSTSRSRSRTPSARRSVRSRTPFAEIRGEIKPHEEKDHGRVAKFLAGEDHGFLKPPMAARSFFTATVFSMTPSTI